MSERKRQLIADLDASRATLVDTVSRLTDAELNRPSPNDGWTVKDTLGHVSAAEGGMLTLLERSLRGESAANPDFDINRFNAGQVRRAKEKAVPELLAQLADSRARLLAMLEPLADADLDRPAHHPVAGDTTFAGIVGIIAWHERSHADDIRRALATALPGDTSPGI